MLLYCVADVDATEYAYAYELELYGQPTFLIYPGSAVPKRRNAGIWSLFLRIA